MSLEEHAVKKMYHQYISQKSSLKSYVNFLKIEDQGFVCK